MSNRSVGGEVARKACVDFPNTASLVLAKKIFKENRKAFKSVDQAYSRIRYYRGTHGSQNRRRVKEAVAVESPRVWIPSSDARPVVPYDLPCTGNGIICGDIHLPYHDERAMEATFEYAIRKGYTDYLILNGDILDFYRISRWIKNPNMRDFGGEVEMGREFLKSLKSVFKTVIYKLGNHEVRYWDYMRVKAPEFVDVEHFSFESLLHLSEIGIEYVAPTQVIYAAALTILHGHEWGKGTFSPVNPARGAYLRAHACTVSGHLHRSSSHTEPDIRGEPTTCWSHGCLCEMHPEYAPINKWDQSFITMEFDGKWFELAIRKIINGRIA